MNLDTILPRRSSKRRITVITVATSSGALWHMVLCAKVCNDEAESGVGCNDDDDDDDDDDDYDDDDGEGVLLHMMMMTTMMIMEHLVITAAI